MESSDNLTNANNEPGVSQNLETEDDNENIKQKSSKSSESLEPNSLSSNESEIRKNEQQKKIQNITDSTTEKTQENNDEVERHTEIIIKHESDSPTTSIKNDNNENITSHNREIGEGLEQNDSDDSLGNILKRYMAVVEAKNSVDAKAAGTSKSTLQTVKNFFSLNSILRGKKPSKIKLNPVLFSYAASHRPRQPFMRQQGQNQGQDPNQNQLPPPPSYYASEVTGSQHQPQQIRETTGRRLSVTFRQPLHSSEEPQQIQPQRQETYRDPYGRSMGQMFMGPNTYMNIPFWAPYPEHIPPNVPACLAHLINADSLFIVQQMDIIELIINVSEPNFFLIQNREGQCIYYAYETSNLCVQYCCRSCRGFQLHIMDIYENEIIYINKPCGCNDYFCCYPVMEVYSPPLVPVGAITQTFNASHIEFVIVDADENKIFKIHGPCVCMTMNCCVEADFTIHALDENETEVGIIRRHWGGYVRTYFTNADLYGITFPVDLDVRLKAVFLGALFLIQWRDALYLTSKKPISTSKLLSGRDVNISIDNYENLKMSVPFSAVNVINFLQLIGKLKSLKRTGWVLRNVEDPETVSGHMYRMSVMAFLIPDSVGVDKTKCMKLSIVHDLAECIVGDLTPYCGVDPTLKHKKEDDAMKELSQMIGDSGTEIYSLYKEYEAQITEESKFVKDLDRLDMVLQAYEYEKSEEKPGKLEEFFVSTLNKFHFPWTIDLVKEICKQRNQFLKKTEV